MSRNLKFQKGDKLRVLRGFSDKLIEGSIVVCHRQTEAYTYIENSPDLCWYHDRFELVDDLTPAYTKALANVGKTVKHDRAYPNGDSGIVGHTIKGVGIATKSMADLTNGAYPKRVLEHAKENGFCVYYTTLDSALNYIPADDVEIHVPITQVEVQLNSGYKAVVTKDKVVVGCQTFPAGILNDLMDAHNKIEA